MEVDYIRRKSLITVRLEVEVGGEGVPECVNAGLYLSTNVCVCVCVTMCTVNFHVYAFPALY